MCDFSTALLATQVIGGAYSAVTQAAIGRQNAAIARQEAQQTADIGAYNDARGREKMDRLIGQQRAQIAARGARLDSGSALDLGQEAGQQKALESAATRYNTQSRVNASLNEAKISEYSATVGLVNGFFGTGAKALSTSLDLWPQLAGA